MEEKTKMNRIDDEFLEKSSGRVYNKVISETEKDLIEKTLKRAFGNQSIAAKILGINRNTLRMKVKKLDINVKEYKI